MKYRKPGRPRLYNKPTLTRRMKDAAILLQQPIEFPDPSVHPLARNKTVVLREDGSEDIFDTSQEALKP
jgi:hypothetical protein